MLFTVQGQRPVYLSVSGQLIHLFKIPIQALVIIVCPRPAFLKCAPRKVPKYLPAPGKLIQGKLPSQVRIVFQNEPDIVDCGLYRPCLVIQFQVNRPFKVFTIAVH